MNYVKTGVHDGFLIFYNLRVNREFVYQWLEMFRPRWKKYGQPGSQVNLNSDLVRKQIIFLPSGAEQEQIVGLLSELDKAIVLQQHKVDLLKQLKRGHLQKLFPVGSAKQPELRFSGFDGDWVQRKLGDVGEVIRKIVDPQLTPESTFVEYSMPSYDQGELPKHVLGKSMQSTRFRISGHVLLINKLNVRQRRIWLVKDAPVNSVSSSEFVPFVPKNADIHFVHQLMLSNKTTRELESISSGTSNSQKRVTPSDLLNFRVWLPQSLDEQCKIGHFLMYLDTTIALQQSKLESLKTLKQAYLQKLFV